MVGLPPEVLAKMVELGGRNADAARIELAKRKLDQFGKPLEGVGEQVPLAKQNELANPTSDKKLRYIVPE